MKLRISSGLAATLLLFATIGLPVHTWAEGSADPSLRPSLRLFQAGFTYHLPAQWSAEDYPQLNAIILLGPQQSDTASRPRPWRGRIVLELVQPKLRSWSTGKGPLLVNALSDKQLSHMKWSPEAKLVKAQVARHPGGFEYGLARIEGVQAGKKQIEIRALIPSKQSDAPWLALITQLPEPVNSRTASADEKLFEEFIQSLQRR